VSSLIDISGLHYRYPGADADALAGLDLRVAEGEFVAIVGPNGSGKSTLARIVGGLAAASGGHCALVCGHDLLTGPGRLGVRRDVGVLFQNPENQLVAENVEEDLAFGLENIGLPASEIAARVGEMLSRFGLEELRHREPHLLSGGQKQRTALAGVLAIPRRALVLDEPTAMLDPAGQVEVLEAVARERANGLTIVLVTQEMDQVLSADRVVALEHGSAVFDGSPAELFARPQLIADLSLGLPAAGDLGLALIQDGRRFAHTPLTLDELLDELAGSGGTQLTFGGASEHATSAEGPALAPQEPHAGTDSRASVRGGDES
jgi:energy-coupling factor transport system ATP-binding protein